MTARADRSLRVLVAVLLAILAWGSLAWSSAARADPPRDVTIERDEIASLPDPPAGFVREQEGVVRWEFHPRATSIVRDLQSVRGEEWPRLVEELGVEIDGSLVIRVGRDPEEMAALAPRAHPPPAYASGVAYPQRGLVLLTLSAPETWERPDVETVLVHELSHVALHRAVNGHRVPRWFSEGVAIHQAREKSLDRLRALWSGTVGGHLVPLERLSRAFPSQPHRVNLAYAQSADFVRWLYAREDGEARFRALIGRLGRGQAFEAALERTYAMSMRSLEVEWHDALGERFKAWPLLFGSGTLWGFAALLVVIAYVRRKRRDRAKLREWEEEERAVLAAARVLAAEIHAQPDDADGDREILFVVPPEPRYRESGVPIVQHDGRAHTLH